MRDHFFLPFDRLPSATHQEKQSTIKNGKHVVYCNDRLEKATEDLTYVMIPFQPEKPLEGAVYLHVMWLYPAGKSHKDGEYKITRPDTDNLIKGLKDIMTRLHFWGDDSQVAVELLEKRYTTNQTGIFICYGDAEEAEE